MTLPPLPAASPRDVRAFFPPGMYVPGWDGLISYDTFDTGLDGWAPAHYDSSGDFIYGPVCWDASRGRHGGGCMKLSSGPSNNVQTATNPTAIKRMGRIYESGFILYSAWVSMRSNVQPGDPRKITIGMDTQQWDNYSRAFPKLNYNRWHGATNADEITDNGASPDWSITDNVGADVTIPNSGPNAPAYGGGAAVVGQGAAFGSNEGKPGWFNIGLVFNLDTVDVSGNKVGGYHRAMFGNKWWDISGLGGGRGAQPPQIATGDYAGGFNIMLSASMRRQGTTGPYNVWVDDVLAMHYPAGTVFPTGLNG